MIQIKCLINLLGNTFDKIERILYVTLIIVSVTKKSGWIFLIAGSATSLVGATGFIIFYLQLFNKCCQFSKKCDIRQSPKRNSYILPVALTLSAIVIALAAVFLPKIYISENEVATFVVAKNNILKSIQKYDSSKKKTELLQNEHCFPVTLGAFLKDAYLRKQNILLDPIQSFYNQCDSAVQPLRKVIHKYEDKTVIVFSYQNSLFLIPRVFCIVFLAVVVFTDNIKKFLQKRSGGIVCEGISLILEEKTLLIDAFGVACFYSCIIVLGCQIFLYQFFTEIELLIYSYKPTFAERFFLDVTSEFLLISSYISLKNSYIFTLQN